MDIKLYYLSYCPFCHRLKEFLEEQNITFDLVDVTDDLDLKEEIKTKTKHPTFPQLIIDDVFVGDCSYVIDNFKNIKEEFKL